MIGGRGEKSVNRSFNRAVNAYRSPGSQFKVLAAYLPAIDLGFVSPATAIDDSPFVYIDPWMGEYIPRNWYGTTYEGIQNVRRGIYRSMNILAVKTYVEVGADSAFEYLKNLGFTSLEGPMANGKWYADKHPSVPLGGLTKGVSLIELVSAYGAIANDGVYNKPILYTKVLDHEGNVILENLPEAKQVVKRTTAFLLTDMMRDTMRIGTGAPAQFKEVKMPTAGKTGTTTDTVDISFTGYTPYYTCSVWLGYDQQKKMDNMQSANLTLWNKVMETIHVGLEERAFERPPGITSASVCRDSGKLPTELCRSDPRGDRTITDLFVNGMVPRDYCSLHQALIIDTSTNMLSNAYCPFFFLDSRVTIVLPYTRGEGTIADSAYVYDGSLSECTVHGPFSMGEWPWYTPPTGGESGENPGEPGGEPGLGYYDDWGNWIPITPTTPPATDPGGTGMPDDNWGALPNG
jgi:penicillin-binding protein 1A